MKPPYKITSCKPATLRLTLQNQFLTLICIIVRLYLQNTTGQHVRRGDGRTRHQQRTCLCPKTILVKLIRLVCLTIYSLRDNKKKNIRGTITRVYHA